MNLDLIGTWGRDSYLKVIDYNKHIFNHHSNPEINNSIAYSRSVIKRARDMKIKEFAVRILNFPQGEVIAKISFQDFLKNMKSIEYSGKINSDSQFCVNLKHWRIEKI